MLNQTLITLYSRDLQKLIAELNGYNIEDNIWHIEGNILNSAGNLTLHLVGNLNAFIGAELGASGYIRERPLEFSTKNTPRTTLIAMVEATITMINKTISGLSDADLAADYPVIVFEEKMTTSYFLIHLSTHLNYHLGQINYHRRLVEG